MSVETLIQEYHQLSTADKARFLELIETDVLLWADEATRSHRSRRRNPPGVFQL